MEYRITKILGPFETDEGPHCRVEFEVQNAIPALQASDKITMAIVVPAPGTASLDLITRAAAVRASETLRRVADFLETKA